MTDRIQKNIEIWAPDNEAFEYFVNKLSFWWPHAYTWAQDALETIGIEPFPGGFCYEKGPHDFTCHWGRVLTYNPPHSIVFTWQISPSRVPEPDPAKSSEVEIMFKSLQEEKTLLVLEHRNFFKHGEKYEEYLKAMNSEQGWSYILECFARHVEEAVGSSHKK